MNKKTLYSILSVSAILISFAGVARAVNGPDVWTTKLQASFTTIGASVVIIGWIITGILYLTAAGSPEKTGVAKKSLVACVIGTVLIIIAATAQDFITTTLGM